MIDMKKAYLRLFLPENEEYLWETRKKIHFILCAQCHNVNLHAWSIDILWWFNLCLRFQRLCYLHISWHFRSYCSRSKTSMKFERKVWDPVLRKVTVRYVPFLHAKYVHGKWFGIRPHLWRFAVGKIVIVCAICSIHRAIRISRLRRWVTYTDGETAKMRTSVGSVSKYPLLFYLL